MKPIDEIRWKNLIRLIEEAGGDDALAEKYGCTMPYISQMRLRTIDKKTGSAKGIGKGTARKLEQVMGKPEGWMDTDIASPHSLSDDHVLLIDAFDCAPEEGKNMLRTMAKTLLSAHGSASKKRTA